MNTYTVHMTPTLNESSALERFERSNAIAVWNRIMFDFYPGLPHINLTSMKDLGGKKKRVFEHHFPLTVSTPVAT